MIHRELGARFQKWPLQFLIVQQDTGHQSWPRSTAGGMGSPWSVRTPGQMIWPLFLLFSLPVDKTNKQTIFKIWVIILKKLWQKKIHTQKKQPPCSRRYYICIIINGNWISDLILVFNYSITFFMCESKNQPNVRNEPAHEIMVLIT